MQQNNLSMPGTIKLKGASVSVQGGGESQQETNDVIMSSPMGETKPASFKEQVNELLQGLFKEQNRNKQLFQQSVSLLQKM